MNGDLISVLFKEGIKVSVPDREGGGRKTTSSPTVRPLYPSRIKTANPACAKCMSGVNASTMPRSRMMSKLRQSARLHSLSARS